MLSQAWWPSVEPASIPLGQAEALLLAHVPPAQPLAELFGAVAFLRPPHQCAH